MPKHVLDLRLDRYALASAEHGSFRRAASALDANGSRAVIPEARSRFPGLHVVSITAPPAMIATRLQSRGRETTGMMADRLARAGSVDVCDGAIHEIDNSGAPEAGGETLIAPCLRSGTHQFQSNRRNGPPPPPGGQQGG